MPDVVPTTRAYLFLAKLRFGEIRKDEIRSPPAFLIAMRDEDITPYLEREMQKSKQAQRAASGGDSIETSHHAQHRTRHPVRFVLLGAAPDSRYPELSSHVCHPERREAREAAGRKRAAGSRPQLRSSSVRVSSAGIPDIFLPCARGGSSRPVHRDESPGRQGIAGASQCP